ncbi:MAG: tetratricopeptide repeat protein [Acidobacteriota bacterium]
MTTQRVETSPGSPADGSAAASSRSRWKRNERRYRIAIAALAALLIFALTSWQRERSRHELELELSASQQRDAAQREMAGLYARVMRAIVEDPNRPQSPEEAVQQFTDKATEAISAGDPTPAEQAALAGGIGEILREMGFRSEATVFMDQALRTALAHYGQPHPEVAQRLDNVGAVLHEREEHAQAEVALTAAVSQRQDLGVADRGLLHSKRSLAATLRSQNRHAEALELYLEVLAGWVRAKGSIGRAADSELATSHWDLGSTYYALGDFDSAEPHASQALEMRRNESPRVDDHVYKAIFLMARVRAERGLRPESEALYREALRILNQGEISRSGIKAARIKAELAGLLAPVNLETARRLVDESLKTLSPRAPNHAATAEAMGVLGAILVENYELEQAEPYLRESLRQIRIQRGDASWRTRRAIQRLIDLYEAWEKPEKQSRYVALLAELAPP